ncbi:MAG: sigma-70 family RNA polymerase sigma factor [Acidobacteriales bacterium]|nr:sigma-70 family RNA polymerase sigma factor [Terriglobales bacterium]
MPLDPDPGTPDSPQLSGGKRVKSDVGSVALNQRLYTTGEARPNGGAGTVAVGLVEYAQLSDTDVMLRAQAGDDAAFDYLVQKFRRPLVSFMYRMARNLAVAEELSQEVFLRVYRSRQSYAAEAKFTTWLYRIATNLALNHIRDTKHERPENSVALDESDEESGLAFELPDPSLTAEQKMLRRERMQAIRKHVESLPERQRMAVVMHKYQSMDYREISKVLKLSESATKSLLFRAYETLREKLKDFV